jgi:hypothetical protein
MNESTYATVSYSFTAKYTTLFRKMNAQKSLVKMHPVRADHRRNGMLDPEYRKEKDLA